MKNSKKIIIILLILSIAIAICILILKIRKQGEEMFFEEIDTSQDFINSMGVVNSDITFFSVEKMLNNYILKAVTENSEAVYGLLDKTYIRQHNITEENVLNQIPNSVKTADNVRIRRMYSQTNLDDEVYYIYCMLEENGIGEENYFAIYVDRKNETYSVAQLSRETLVKEVGAANETLEEKEIEKNEYNQTLREAPSEQILVDRYFYDFIGNAVFYPEYAYSLLDEEYKKERFPTIQDFTNYIDTKGNLYSAAVTSRKYEDFNNMDDYLLYITNKQKLQLQSYQIREEENYKRYIVMDNYNNYFIFTVTSPLNYTVQLDTYTIDLPDFIEKYDAGTTEEKVGYNMQKIVEAINCSDYHYIYEKLADEFKANYFNTYEEFEEYAKNTFEVKTTVIFNRYTQNGDLSTYEVTLQGRSKEISKTIIMKLGENRDFVISFNLE